LAVTIGGDYGALELLSDGTTLTSVSGPFNNVSNRLPATRPLSVIEVYATSDFGTAVAHAPSGGVMRVPLVLGAEYRIMVPTVVAPLFSYPAGAGTIVFTGDKEVAVVVCPDPSGPVFWGRDVERFVMKNLQFVDATNAGAGRGTTLLNMVGFGNARSIVQRVFVSFIRFKSAGTLVDVFYAAAQADDVLLESGLTIRVNPSAIPFIGAGLGLTTSSFNGSPVAADNRRSSLTFIGAVGQAGIGGSSVQLAKAANSAFHVDASIVSGEISFNGILYGGPATAGQFFRPTLVQSITAQANADIVITSFADSTANPGVDTTVNFGTAVDFVRGQVILIADEAAYDGLHAIVRVAADQESFDINVVHSTSGAGTLKMVEHTVASNGLARDETVVVTGTTDYNGTEQTLRISDTSFHLPQVFVPGPPQAGTATSTGQDQTSTVVSVSVAGNQQDSKSIGSVVATGNAVVTTIALINTWTDLNLNALAVAGSNIELWGSVNSTTGEVTYNGTPAFSGEILASMSVTSTGGSQSFQFRAVVNGSPLSDGVVVSVDLSSSPMISVTLVAPIQSVTGDTVRVQVQNISGTSDVLIQDLSMVIS
jgi:hypothetical protein